MDMKLEVAVLPVYDVDKAGDSVPTTIESASDLASALRRAAAAHGPHEKRAARRTRTGRTGRTATCYTWSGNRPGRSCPHDQ